MRLHAHDVATTVRSPWACDTSSMQSTAAKTRAAEVQSGPQLWSTSSLSLGAEKGGSKSPVSTSILASCGQIACVMRLCVRVQCASKAWGLDVLLGLDQRKKGEEKAL